MASTQLEIHLLGPLTVVRDTTVIQLPRSRKARALLAYLAATGGEHSRSALGELLWNEVSSPRAAVRWALSKIREVVEAEDRERILTSRDLVQLDVQGVHVDLHRARAAVAADGASWSVDDLGAVADALGGEFLDGLELPACHQWDTWCLGMRETCRRMHVAIRDRLVDRLRDDAEAALPHALARIAADPVAEQGYIAAMDLLASLGRRRRARELYDRCRRVRQERLGERPSAQLVAALRRLTPPPPDRREAGKARPAALAELLATLTVPPDLPEVTGSEPRLVGRTGEMDRLRTALRRAGSDGPAAMLITGEPGIGKTRLLRELAASVREAAGWVLSGRVMESEEVRPYGPWTDIVRQVPDAALDEELRRKLAGFLPRTGARTDGPAERAELFDGVADLLRRLVSARAPGLIVLDDVQWLDEASAALLHFIVRTQHASGVFFACAARDGEAGRPATLPRLVRSLSGAGHLESMALGRLTYDDTTALVVSVDGAVDAEPIFRSSEGNPLFALELVRAWRDGTPGSSATIEHELDARLSRLDPEALDLLTWAAALGREFSVPTLMRTLDRAQPTVVSALGRLETGGILRPSGQDAYDFRHPLLREAALRRLSAPARRAVHRHIAQVLDESGAGARRVPGTVAHHAQLGGLPDLAARACAEAADEFAWVFAFSEAAEVLDRGLAQARLLPDTARIRLELDLLRLYVSSSMRSVRPQDLEEQVRRVLQDAGQAGMTDVVAAAHFQLAALQFQRDAFEETRVSSVLSAEAGQRAEPRSAARALAEAATCLLLIDRDVDHARHLTAEAQTLAQAVDAEVIEVALATALVDHHDGKLPEAARGFEDVIRLGRRVRDRWWECPALTRRILTDLQRGAAPDALERTGEAESLAERLGDDAEAAFARGLAGVAVAIAGDDDAEQGRGLQLADEAIRELRDLDSLWRLAQVQTHAAEVELERDRPAAARQRAREVLHAGESLHRPSLTALGLAQLSRSAALAADPREARARLQAADHLLQTRPVSSQARQAVERARRALTERSGDRVEHHA